jgi:hypothetical protein
MNQLLRVSENVYFLDYRLTSCYQPVGLFLNFEKEIRDVEPSAEVSRGRKIWPQHLAASLGKVSVPL